MATLTPPANASFDLLLNLRDSGTTVNEFSQTKLIRPGLLYRSARPDFASDRDYARLEHEYIINTVIDLRSRTEHIEAAKKVHSSHAISKKVSNSPTQVPGARTILINLNGKGFERHLVWKLSYLNLMKLVFLMVLGYRIQAISILGRNVLRPRGLNGLAQDTIEHSKPEIKEAFNVLSDTNTYPVLVHCTQGKDRTGLIILLVLLLCQVPVDAISHDYMLSEKALQPEFEDRMREISSIGLDESFARCAPSFAYSVSQYLTDVYGGIEQYLMQIGVTDDQIRTIKLTLMA